MSSKKLHSFSPDANFLAICQPNGTLRVWNTNNNVLVHEFEPSEHLKATTTCLSFSKSMRKRRPSKRKKKGPEDDRDGTSNYLIAMGTVAGTTFIYNPSLQELIGTLGESSSRVLDLAWEADNVLVTLTEDGTLTYWDVIKLKVLRNLKVGKRSSFCLIARNQLVVASTGIKMIHLDSEPHKKHRFTGHKNNVTHLAPIHLGVENSATHFLSAAEDERFVYAWSAACESQDPIAAFSINDTVRSLSCTRLDDTSVGIIVITKKGILQYFSHHLNGVRKKKPIKNCQSLRVELDAKTPEVQIMPILTAHFISKEVILFTYGSELFLRSEKLNISNLFERTILKRSDPSVFKSKKESKLLKTVAPHVSSDVVHLTPSYFSEKQEVESGSKRKRGDSIQHMPMEERLNALSINKHTSFQRGPLISDSVHLLMQGLHSKDTRLLYSVLMKGENEEVVNNTIKSLPVQCIVPLLGSLQEFLIGKGLKNVAIINWIKSLLVHHMSHLSTLPNKQSILDPFRIMGEARANTLTEVTKLHSRLDLLLTHVRSRHDNSNRKEAQQDPLLVYREDFEDEENRMDATILSESEEFADTWSEADTDEEENGGTSGESKRKSSLSGEETRRTISNDASLVISDSEEDEFDVDSEDEGCEQDEQMDEESVSSNSDEHSDLSD